MRIIEWMILILCLCASLAGLWLGVDAHYTQECREHGFREALLTVRGVVCEESGERMFLRELEGKYFIHPDPTLPSPNIREEKEREVFGEGSRI